MQAIVTKYIAPTDFKGTRMKATCAGGQVTVRYDYELDAEENHRAACEALLAKMEWIAETMVGGTIRNGDFVWVLVKGSPTAFGPTGGWK